MSFNGTAGALDVYRRDGFKPSGPPLDKTTYHWFNAVSLEQPTDNQVAVNPYVWTVVNPIGGTSGILSGANNTITVNNSGANTQRLINAELFLDGTSNAADTFVLNESTNGGLYSPIAYITSPTGASTKRFNKLVKVEAGYIMRYQIQYISAGAGFALNGAPPVTVFPFFEITVLE